MSGKYFLIDTTRCTACRGCQLACKQWNHLPAQATKQRGSNQNPLELSADTWRLVRFAEQPGKTRRVDWLFFSDACRHCLEPACKETADDIVPGAITVAKSGAVIFTEKTSKLKDAAGDIKDACPWSIPNWSPRLGRLVKCDMCNQRVEAGLPPACVKTCPTGALNFGSEAAMKKLATARLKKAQAKFGQAQILDHEDVRALYLVVHPYDMYLE